MVVLVLWVCLASQPSECTSVNLPGRLPHHQCVAFAAAEARDFEARNPDRRVRRSWCLRQGSKVA